MILLWFNGYNNIIFNGQKIEAYKHRCPQKTVNTTQTRTHHPTVRMCVIHPNVCPVVALLPTQSQPKTVSAGRLLIHEFAHMIWMHHNRYSLFCSHLNHRHIRENVICRASCLWMLNKKHKVLMLSNWANAPRRRRLEIVFAFGFFRLLSLNHTLHRFEASKTKQYYRDLVYFFDNYLVTTLPFLSRSLSVSRTHISVHFHTTHFTRTS